MNIKKLNEEFDKIFKENTRDKFTEEEIDELKEVANRGDWEAALTIVKKKFGNDVDKQHWNDEDWDDYLYGNFGWILA